MTDAKHKNMDDQFCEYVAQMVCIRPTMYVKTGALLSLVDNGPSPRRCARSVTCASCEGTMPKYERGRMLCGACRKKPEVFHGAPLIDTMYRSAHPKYVLNKDMEAIVATIGKQREIASHERGVAKQLAYWAYMVYEKWKLGGCDMNVYFTPDHVNRSGSYAQAITNSNPRYVEDNCVDGGGNKGYRESLPRHLAVTVGGLGIKFQHIVKQSVVDWLYNLDAMIRKRFGIELVRGQRNGSMISDVVEHFATLISNRVVLLENIRDDPTEHLCSVGFEHVAEIQFVRCKHYAARLASADIRSMRELVSLVQEMKVPESRQQLIDFLKSPCPELLKALPSVTHDMRFVELVDVLSQAHDVDRKLKEWSVSIAVESLCMLLERAIELTQKWKGGFLKCLRYDEDNVKECLPAQGWVDDPRIASWSLVSSATHAHRRTGLDPPGLRIVLMSSALMQINGNGTFFRPGVMRCDLMSPAANNHEYLSTYAYNALGEQLWPYMTGAPWKYARNEMTMWQGSHIEGDVRRAAALLGGFSVDEIIARYVSDTSQSHLDARLIRTTTQKMVFKPQPQYEQWFPVAVDLLIPILSQLRQAVGIANMVPTSPIGDVLRLAPSVRDWKPVDGPLQLTTGEAYHIPCLKTVLMELLASQSKLVKQKRVGTRMCWVLDPIALAEVLGK